MRVAALLLAGPALTGFAIAAMPPEVYEQARQEARDVIVIAAEGAAPPPGDHGDCAVSGIVRAVERGQVHAVGDAVTIHVPCFLPGADLAVGGAIYWEYEVLAAPHYGRAFLDDTMTVVLSQYDILSPEEAGEAPRTKGQ